MSAAKERVKKFKKKLNPNQDPGEPGKGNEPPKHVLGLLPSKPPSLTGLGADGRVDRAAPKE